MIAGLGRQSKCKKLLRTVDKYDKWMVSGTVFVFVVRYWGLTAVWTLLGALLNALICKISKKIINQPRPGEMANSDPGMPSSHACSLFFLGVSGALLLTYYPNGNQNVTPNIRKYVLQAGLMIVATFLTYLRWMFGHHSVKQVGFIL